MSWSWEKRLSVAACMSASLLLTSCAILRGAPRPPLPATLLDPGPSDTDLTLTAADVVALETIQDLKTRNSLITKALLAIDLRYAQFRHLIWAEERQTGAVTSLLTLGASVAGSLTNSIGVKNNYLALSALLTGTSQTIDSKYLSDRTSIALVTTMDANRLAVAERIMRGMNQPVESYGGYAALRDLVDYYNAGTLTDALAKVQDQASTAKEENSKALKLITPMTVEQISALSGQTTSIFAIQFTEADRAKLVAILNEFGAADVDPNAPIAELRKQLIRLYQDLGTQGQGQESALVAALKTNGFVH